MGWRHHGAIARASTRIEFQEALIRFSKLGFPVAHGRFLSLEYEIIYKFILDARAAARSGKGKTLSTTLRVTFNTLLFNIIRVCRSRYVL